MAARALFAEPFDDAGTVVGRTHRRPASAPAAVATRFQYPELAQPSAAPSAPAPDAAAPTFTAGELAHAVETARQEARLEAEAVVRAELQTSFEQRQAEALGAIATELAAARSALAQTLAARAGASRELALALARALVPRALERQPLADIEAMMHSLLLRLEGEARLEVRLPPALLAAGEAMLGSVAAATGFAGELTVVPEPALGPGDARIAWRDGMAERDLARLEAETVALVEAWLADHSNPAPGGAPAQLPAAQMQEAER